MQNFLTHCPNEKTNFVSIAYDLSLKKRFTIHHNYLSNYIKKSSYVVEEGLSWETLSRTYDLSGKR